MKSRYNTTWIHVLFLSLLVAWLLTGCGGGRPAPVAPDPNPASETSDNQGNQQTDPLDLRFYTPDPSQPTGNLSFHVAWPDGHSGQIIPGGTNRITIYITGKGIVPAIGVILNNTSGGSAHVAVEVPAGKDRLVSVTARHLDHLAPDVPAINTEPRYRDLLEGKVLATGSTDAFDLAEDELKSLTITLVEPGRPADSSPVITSGGSQFDATDFPTVVVYGSAVDENGDPITGLTMGNFRVFEQSAGMITSRECIITDMRYVGDSGGLRAGSVVLCLDKSGSMYWTGGGIADLKAAAHQFVNMMYKDDRGEIINFSSDVYISQPFTTDKALLHAAVNIDIGDNTALLDAAYTSIEEASKQPGRKAVLIMTDGNENWSSYATVASVGALALQTKVPCYTIGLGDVNTYLLNALAQATGGVAYFTPTPGDLEDIYKQIAIDLAFQIRITYVSCDPINYDPDKLRHVYVYLTNYPPLTDKGDILAFETTYHY